MTRKTALRNRGSAGFSAGLRRRPDAEPLPSTQEVRQSRTDRFAARDFSGLLGMAGLSDRLLQLHFEFYQGYVRNAGRILDELDELRERGRTDSAAFAELRRRFGWEYDGIRLHELYFENLAKEPEAADPESPLCRRLAEDFGSVEGWQEDFRAVAATRGIGWVALFHDPLRNRLFNAWIEEHHQGPLLGAAPILVMDLWEHAYLSDYGTKRADYVDAVLRAFHWDRATARFQPAGDAVEGGLG